MRQSPDDVPVESLSSEFLEAFPAVNGTVVGGLEGDLGLYTAFGADDREHFSFPGSAGPLAGGTALRAASGIVLEPFFCVELLFGSGKSELSAAFFAGEHSVFKSHCCRILLKCFPYAVCVSREAVRHRKASEENSG